MKIFRSLIAAAAIAVTATTVVAVPAAHAATGVTACFRFSTGATYANKPMDLWKTDSAGNLISIVKSGNTGANGCGTFYGTPSNLRLTAVAQYNQSTVKPHYDHYIGYSPLVALPGSGTTNIGTGYVYYAWSI